MAVLMQHQLDRFPGFPEGVEGFDLVSKIQAQAERFGARVEFSAVESVDLSMKPFQLKVEDDVTISVP